MTTFLTVSLCVSLLLTLYFFYRWRIEKKLGVVSRNAYERDRKHRDRQLKSHIPFGESL